MINVYLDLDGCVVNFDKLTFEQANKVAFQNGIELQPKSENTWTIAEIFHEQNIKPIQKFGFN